MTQNISFDKKIGLAWGHLAEGVVNQDINEVQKYFFWLKKLYKLKAESINIPVIRLDDQDQPIIK